MKYCSQCGASVQLNVPPGDNRERHVCGACGTIHYQNPRIIVGCIPEWGDRILLCRRAIEPRSGLWTVPAGFMERGETTQAGAARETLEEANARVDVGPLHSYFNLPHIDQIYLLFRARLLDLDFAPGAESLEVKLFAESDIPWDDIAFQVVREALRLHFQDRAAGREAFYTGDIRRAGANLRHHVDIRREL